MIAFLEYQNFFYYISLLYIIDNVHSRYYFSENSMLAVKMRLGLMGDKELASVCSWTGIGH